MVDKSKITKYFSEKNRSKMDGQIKIYMMNLESVFGDNLLK